MFFIFIESMKTEVPSTEIEIFNHNKELKDLIKKAIILNPDIYGEDLIKNFKMVFHGLKPMYYVHIQSEIKQDILIKNENTTIFVHSFMYKNKNECALWIINNNITTILKDIQTPINLSNIDDLIIVLKNVYSHKKAKFYRQFIIGCCLGYPPTSSLLFAKEAFSNHTQTNPSRVFISSGSRFVIVAYKSLPDSIKESKLMVNFFEDIYSLI